MAEPTALRRRIAAGEVALGISFTLGTEPGGGSDLQAMRTTARREGDHYVINGSTTWLTNARRSPLVALTCKTDPAADPPHRGASIVLAEQGPGFALSRDLPKVGYKGVESCEIAFDNFQVPAPLCWGRAKGGGSRRRCAAWRWAVSRWRAVRSASAGPLWRTHCAMPRSGSRSAGYGYSTEFDVETVFPGCSAHDRGRGHQRDRAQRDRAPADQLKQDRAMTALSGRDE